MPSKIAKNVNRHRQSYRVVKNCKQIDLDASNLNAKLKQDQQEEIGYVASHSSSKVTSDAGSSLSALGNVVTSAVKNAAPISHADTDELPKKQSNRLKSKLDRERNSNVSSDVGSSRSALVNVVTSAVDNAAPISHVDTDELPKKQSNRLKSKLDREHNSNVSSDVGSSLSALGKVVTSAVNNAAPISHVDTDELPKKQSNRLKSKLNRKHNSNVSPDVISSRSALVNVFKAAVNNAAPISSVDTDEVPKKQSNRLKSKLDRERNSNVSSDVGSSRSALVNVVTSAVDNAAPISHVDTDELPKKQSNRLKSKLDREHNSNVSSDVGSSLSAFGKVVTSAVKNAAPISHVDTDEVPKKQSNRLKSKLNREHNSNVSSDVSSSLNTLVNVVKTAVNNAAPISPVDTDEVPKKQSKLDRERNSNVSSDVGSSRSALGNVVTSAVKKAAPISHVDTDEVPKKQSKLDRERNSNVSSDVGSSRSALVNVVTSAVKNAAPMSHVDIDELPKKQSNRLKSKLNRDHNSNVSSGVSSSRSALVSVVKAAVNNAAPISPVDTDEVPKKQSNRLKSKLDRERNSNVSSDVGSSRSALGNVVTSAVKNAAPISHVDTDELPKKQSNRLKSKLNREHNSNVSLDVSSSRSALVNVAKATVHNAGLVSSMTTDEPPKKQSNRLKSKLDRDCNSNVVIAAVNNAGLVSSVTTDEPPKKQSNRVKSKLDRERKRKVSSDVVSSSSAPVNVVIAAVHNAEPIGPVNTDDPADVCLGVSVGPEKTTKIQTSNARKKKFTRHRKQMKSAWPREITKNNREHGKAFKGYTKTDKGMVHGVDRPEIQHGPRCSSQFCFTSKERNCHDVDENKRAANFNGFWDDLDWDQKKIYIASLVDVDKTQRKVVVESRRSNSSKYFLKIDNRRVQVCKKFFLSSFGLNEWMVRDWTTNNNNGMIPAKATLNARRKANRLPSQKSLADKERKDFLLKFFDDLPKMPSHYCRQRTDKSYIEPNFQTLAELYRYYQMLCAESQKGSLSYGFFCDLFKDRKLSLYQPKKDRCDTCEGHDKGNVPSDEYNVHVSLKDRAREEKDRDKNRALAGEIHAYVWDVQAVKLCPVSNASALYFKQKLKVHNFSIYDLCSKDCMNNWWHEGEGQMDASIFTTCVNDFLNENCNDDLPIVVWSDGCGYQNRNQILSNSLLDYAVRNNKSVQQKFLVKGHTQMEVDNVHALIEKKLSGRTINLPSDYIKATIEARKTVPLKAKLYNHQDFRNYDDSSLFRYNSIRPGKNTGDDTVQHLRVLDYSPNGEISYKINFDDPLQPLPRKPKQPTLTYDQIQPLYTEEIKISAKRYNDLQDLKIILSKDSHEFYDLLKHEN